jgi:hypothetical protein
MSSGIKNAKVNPSEGEPGLHSLLKKASLK